MSPPARVSEIQVEGHLFPPTAKPPGTTKTLFLGGAGVRGLYTEGEFVKFTAIGVYLEDNAIESLGLKWKGKSAEELMGSIEFFRDIVTGPFEKFIRLRLIRLLTGEQFSEKVAGNCIAYWNETGTYTDAAGKAIDKFYEAFKGQNFPPGASILFTQSPHGSLTISFSKDESIPETGNAVIENKELSETVLQTIIGKNGVSPAAKLSLATRMSEFLNKYNSN